MGTQNLKDDWEKLDEDELSSDALDGHASIRDWEDNNGRGFWGNSHSGFIYDDDLNDRF